MITIRALANAVLNLERNKYRSIREQIARGEADYAVESERLKSRASASTLRKWRRTHESMGVGK